MRLRLGMAITPIKSEIKSTIWSTPPATRCIRGRVSESAFRNDHQNAPRTPPGVLECQSVQFESTRGDLNARDARVRNAQRKTWFTMGAPCPQPAPRLVLDRTLVCLLRGQTQISEKRWSVLCRNCRGFCGGSNVDVRPLGAVHPRFTRKRVFGLRLFRRAGHENASSILHLAHALIPRARTMIS